MKKSIWTLIIVAAIAFVGQSCEQSSDFEEIVITTENDTDLGSAEDQKDRPGGGS